MMSSVIEDGPNPTAPPSYATVPPARLAVAATLVILFLYFPAQLTQLANPGFGIWFTELFVFFGLASVLVRMSGRDPVRYTGLRWSGSGAAGYGFAFGLMNFFALAIPLQLLAVWLFPESWSQTYDSARILRDKAGVDLAAIILGVTVAAPVCEEYFFRGVLQRALFEDRRLSRLASVLTAAAVFSAFHFDPVGFFPRVELGIVFGWLFWRTGSIWPGVMAHAANNLVSVVLFFAADAEEATARAITAEQLRQTAIFAVIGLTALGGLLVLAAKKRELLAPRYPEHDRGLEPRAFFALVWPWAMGAAISIALLLAVDPRGVALNQFDMRHPLPEAAQEAKTAREELMTLRARARRGEVPQEEYEAARTALIEKYAGEKPPEPAPVPPVPPVPTPR